MGAGYVRAIRAQWAVKVEKWKFWVSGPKLTHLNGFKRLEAAFYDGKTKKIKKPKKFLSFWVFPQKQKFCNFCVFWRKKAIEIDWKRFKPQTCWLLRPNGQNLWKCKKIDQKTSFFDISSLRGVKKMHFPVLKIAWNRKYPP